MTRRCLICSNLNPCHKHSSDEQDRELRRNLAEIRKVSSLPTDKTGDGE